MCTSRSSLSGSLHSPNVFFTISCILYSPTSAMFFFTLIYTCRSHFLVLYDCQYTRSVFLGVLFPANFIHPCVVFFLTFNNISPSHSFLVLLWRRSAFSIFLFFFFLICCILYLPGTLFLRLTLSPCHVPLYLHQHLTVFHILFVYYY